MNLTTIEKGDWSKKTVAGLTNHDAARNLLIQWFEGAPTFSFYTSGSTGEPKEIMFDRTHIEASIKRTLNATGTGADDHFLCTLSPRSIAGALVILRAAYCGATLSLMAPSGNPLSLIDDDHPYTVTSLVPMQICQTPFMHRVNGFKVILIGGAAMSETLESELKDVAPVVFETYGMTETISHIALRRIGIEKSFKVLDGIKIQQSENGCLMIFGDMTRGEWLLTNDLVTLQDEQHFIYLGRVDQMINSGGVKINPIEIENTISKAMQPYRFFIAATPDEKLGEMVTLFIEAPEGSININFNHHHLHPYQIPRKICYLDHFIYTSSGKIDKLRTASGIA